jgi:hypothetical protein
MNLVRVKIKGIVVTPHYGTLSPGDELRASPAFARHLVEDCNAAEYIDAQPAATEIAPAAAQKPKAKAKKGGAA